MKRYAIWNKKDNVITPSGKVYTAEEWMEQYPVAKLENVTVLCSRGTINGAVFGTLENLILQYEDMGVDFSSCKTPEEKLNLIEAFDDEKAAERKAEEAAKEADKVANDELTATSLASIAASMEYQNLLTLEDVEVQ